MPVLILLWLSVFDRDLLPVDALRVAPDKLFEKDSVVAPDKLFELEKVSVVVFVKVACLVNEKDAEMSKLLVVVIE